MDTGIPTEKQQLPLRLAAVLLHIRIIGRPPDASDPVRMRATLNDVARALSMVAPIYSNDPASGMPAKISESALMGATFNQGATVIIGSDGTRYEHLTVKRADIEAAGDILGASKSLQERWTDGE